MMLDTFQEPLCQCTIPPLVTVYAPSIEFIQT